MLRCLPLGVVFDSDTPNARFFGCKTLTIANYMQQLFLAITPAILPIIISFGRSSKFGTVIKKARYRPMSMQTKNMMRFPNLGTSQNSQDSSSAFAIETITKQ